MDLKRTRQISIFSDEIGWICFRERREALTSKWTYRAMWRLLFFCPNKKPDDYINVTIELDDMDITSAETKATYDEIKKYVAEHNAGMKVSNLYISQVKRKCGIEVGKNLRVATRRMDCLQGNSTTAATDLELVPSPNS